MSEITINGTPINKLRVVDLKNELDARGLSKSGKKDELVARLLSYMEHEMTLQQASKAEDLNDESEPKETTDEVKDTEGAEVAVENDADDNQLKEPEEMSLANTKAEEEKKESEVRAAADELQKQKRELEERKLKDAKEEEEKLQKIAEEERLKKEKREKEERKMKDAEERKRLEEEEKRMEEEKQKKIEDRKRMKEAAEKKRSEKNENDKEEKDKKEVCNVNEKHTKDEEKADDLEKKEDGDKTGRYDESLILETAADDTLVMEIDQTDIVAEEVSKEEAESPMISAEPGQVTSLRRLGGSKSSQDASRKRGWGASKSSTASANSVTISSNSLKDLVPDIKPLLDTEATIEEEVEECSVDSDADIAGPKIPDNVKKDSEPVKKKKRIPVTDVNETAVVLITHLTRPFTVNQLKEMLKRTGTIVDFWIDRIKSMCCVQFSTVDQASETRMALDGVTWPQGNPKTLRVTFSTEEELKKYQESSTDALSRLGSDSNGRLGGVREWDKNKLDQEQERAREREKRLAREKERREGKEERERSPEKKAPAVKSLEDLFKKTVASPAIYWKPLSEKQIQQKIEARNKKIMEAQIMREMMDTKESLQRSNKLLPVRRRSRSSSGSSD